MRYPLALLCLAAPYAVQAGCLADNCLRAVRGTYSPRPGTQDCSSFFRATITPATSTSTVTAISYYTSTSTLSLTATNTDHQTLTIISSVTLTTQRSITTTVTSKPPGQVPLIKVKRAVSSENANRLLPPVPLSKVKRQVTVNPTRIPLYASPCSGMARYSSACSCLGIPRTTMTLPAPVTILTTTITISTTETSTDLKTVPTTITDGEVTLTTTVATKTETVVIATQTAYAFILQVADGGVPGAGGKYIQGQHDTIGGGGNPLLLKFTTVREDATKFLIRGDGLLVTYNEGWGIYAGWYNTAWTSSYLYIFPSAFSGAYPISCLLNAAWEISCSGAPPPYISLGTYSNGYSLNIGQAGFNFASIGGVGPIIVKALLF